MGKRHNLVFCSSLFSKNGKIDLNELKNRKGFKRAAMQLAAAVDCNDSSSVCEFVRIGFPTELRMSLLSY